MSSSGSRRDAGSGSGRGTRLAASRWLYRHGPSIAVTVICIVASLVAFAFVRSSNEADKTAIFEQRARELSASVRRTFDYPLEALLSLPPFFEASDRVAREEFGYFVRGALERHPEVYSYQWNPLVPGTWRDEFEREAREDGAPYFALKEIGAAGALIPAGEREEYMPILYEEPAHPVVLGLDLLADLQRSVAPEAARREDRLVASAPFHLLEDPDAGFAVAVYHPVHDAPIVPGAETHNVGLVSMILRISQVMRQALEVAATEGLQVALVDEQAEVGSQLLFELVPDGREAMTMAEQTRITSIPVGDRVFSLLVAPRASLGAGTGPWTVLVVGFGVSLAIGVALILLTTIRRLRKRVVLAMQLGQYRLEQRIGQGGMGQVYRASHALLKRPTAVKLVHPDKANDGALTRFEREVQLTSQLTHPNTIAIFDYGRTPEGIFYYAMEFLDGLNLGVLVKRHGPLPGQRVIHILSQMCGSLAEAHGAGMIHRDIKPENVFLCERGGLHDFVKVLDFGLVEDVLRPEDREPVRPRGVTGTPLHMAPEAIADPGNIDVRSDLYAIGTVGYYLLTGTNVFQAKTPLEVLSGHLHSTPELPSSRVDFPIAEDLEAVLMRCLEKDPADRPQTAEELAAALRACASADRWTARDALLWWSAHAPPPAQFHANGNEPVGTLTASIDLREPARSPG